MTTALRDAIDYTTLGWVKPELDETLRQARIEIEAFAEDPADASRMRFCAGFLHQVQGTLRMVELYAPAMVAEEMEQLAQALQDGRVPDRDEACATLMRGVVLLPDYLERLQGGHRDIPIVLLPLLNELRAARGESGLSESVLFAPDLQKPLPEALGTAGRAPDANAGPLLAQLRDALAAWPEGGAPADAAALAAAVDGLLAQVGEEAGRRMLWVASSVAGALRDGALPPTPALRQAFASVEREARQLLEHDGMRVRADAALEPTRQLLYHVAHAEGDHATLRDLRATFELDAQGPSESELEHARGSVTGRNRALLDTVAAAVKEDLLRVKDALDLHLRGGQPDLETLRPQVEALGRVADTLGMLGLGVARNVVQQQRDALAAIVDRSREADEGALLDVAGALLYVDASLDEQVQRLGGPADGGDEDLLAAESRRVTEVLAREAIANFADARQAFVAFVETNWDHAELAEVPRLLREVAGAMRMLELAPPAGLLDGVRMYTERELIARHRVPNGRQLDTLADALASLEYYLEALREQRPNREDILEIARTSLETLGYWPLPDDVAPEPAILPELPAIAEPEADTGEEALAAPPAEAPVAPAPPAAPAAPLPPSPAAPVAAPVGAGQGGFEASDEIDDEIREVFLEEFEEEIDNLDQLLPPWRAQPDELEKLRPIRRVFHTLKGSGRLVGAKTLGEFSWKIENMLNRVLDGTRPASPAVVAIVDQAFYTLPQLQAALRGEGTISADLDAMQAVADRIAAGEDAYYRPEAMAPMPEAPAQAVPAQEPEPEAVAAAEPVVEEGVPAAVDAVLLEILDTEVEGHLATVDHWLAGALAGPALADEALLRAIHTMNGAFAMTEVPCIPDAITPAEAYVKRLLAARAPVAPEGVAAFADLATAVRATVTALHTPLPHIPRFTALAERLAALRDSLPEATLPVADAPAEAPFLAVDLSAFGGDDVAAPAVERDAEAPSPDAQLLEDERLAAEQRAAEQAAVQAEVERLAAEQAEAERQAAEQAEAERAAAEQAEAARLEAERQAAEQAEAERAAAEQTEAARLEAERLAAEQAEAERLAEEEREYARLEAEYAEQARLAAEQQAEAERRAAEQAAAEQAEAERQAAERAEAERLAAEQAEAERLAAEQAEAERLAAEQAEAERLAAEQAEAERLAAEQAEAERLVAEQAEAERLAAEQAAAERLAEEQAERHAAEQAEAEQAAIEPVVAELLAHAMPSGEDPDEPLDLTGLDPELVEIFVEESVDLLDHSDGLLAQLREAPTEREALVGLQRDLHTIKGGARMAGIMAVGELGHAMESLLEAVVDQRCELGRDGIPLLERGFDRLHAMVTRVGEGRAVALPERLIAEFNARAHGRPLAPEAQAAPAGAAPAQPAAALKPLSAPIGEGGHGEDEDISVRAPQEQVRIRADLLDRLVNYAGEVAIYRARLEQQLGAFRGAMNEMEQTNTRLRDQLRRLDSETEAQIIARYQRESEAGDETFDPLELDRFSTLQQLSRALAESAADLTSLQGSLDDLTRQYETLLLQQSRVSSELQEGLMRTRMVPFDALVPRLRRVLRQAGGETGKQVQLKVEGAQGELDRNVLERMTAPLEHMLRNAVAHGLETPQQRRKAHKPEEGTVRIAVRREGSEMVLEVADDGAGLDRKAIHKRAAERGLIRSDARLADSALDALIFEPGFSTATEVSRLAGRGVGMDVVASEVRQLGGALDIASQPGKGTTFTIRLPQTLAVTQAVFVRIGETSFAVPIASVRGVGRIPRDELEKENASYRYGGEDYALHDLGLLLGQPRAKAEGQLQMPVLLVRSGDLRIAVTVDQVVGNREIVVKPVGPQVASLPGIFGATIMGDGRVVVILDVAPLVRRQAALPRDALRAPEPVVDARKVPLVMVVDDSVTMRKVTGRVLERNNFEVATAKDGIDALERMAEAVPDLMLLDIEMPRMDGYELATAMKADARLRNVPIIMITSRTGEKHRQRAFEIGVQRYLGKPYQEHELMRNVFELLAETEERSTVHG
ncbi:MAG TPA: Hpt domain-containing protein [Xanthomonadaceae bacterium]|nr:Hpt domain-containing protein [Xanthomonadaceae bacterium]